MADAKQFKPALIIVDFQEDFCPPVSLSLCLCHMRPAQVEVSQGAFSFIKNYTYTNRGFHFPVEEVF